MTMCREKVSLETAEKSRKLSAKKKLVGRTERAQTRRRALRRALRQDGSDD